MTQSYLLMILIRDLLKEELIYVSNIII